MGRAIIREPSVFLMDEPLSNLDAKLRVQMRAEIASLQSRLGDHHGVRDARPVRGDDARRSRRGARRRAPPAVRRAPRALRAAREHVRRRLHRLPGDEPLLAATSATTVLSRSAASSSRCRTARAPTGSARRRRRAAPESLELADERDPAPTSRSSRRSAPTPTSSRRPCSPARRPKLVARVEAKSAPGARRPM